MYVYIYPPKSWIGSDTNKGWDFFFFSTKLFYLQLNRQNHVSRVFAFKSPDVEHLQWLQTLKDANVAVEANLQWECQASGKPTPTYRWLKNGQPLAAGVGYA